jgi:hypothetical protein
VFESTVEHFGPPSTAPCTIMDGSDTAMRAAAYAFGLARRQGHRLLVALVGSFSVLAPTGPAMAFEQRTFAQLRAEELGMPVTFLTMHGNPFRQPAVP